MPAPSATELPSLPRDDDGPVFGAPWQAQAFAMTVRLHEQGVFDWPEWAGYLGREIAAAGPNDDGADYYAHWLAALEKLLADKAVLPEAEQARRRQAWERAARATPHGQPIELDRGA